MQNQLSTIEKSVTHLLIATKQLLETLTQWSRKNATETQVSDVYVRLGYEFNIACRAFASINVDVSDLGNVPDALRQILEETLSQEASQKSLDIYLPKIRDIIINLLHGLKRKQAKLRAKAKESQTLPRAVSGASMSSTSTGNSGLAEMLEEIPNNYASGGRSNSPARRQINQAEEPRIPARNSSSQRGKESREGLPQHAYSNSRDEILHRQPGIRDDSPSAMELNVRIQRERKVNAPSVSSMSSEVMQTIPVISPLDDRTTEIASFIDDLPPPPPPPKQSDALLALQRGGELERRASRRYSAYQIQKLVGAGPGGVPNLPPQNSPIPNRGRDVKESLNAVRTRSSVLLSRQRSQRLRESPHRSTTSTQRISEERDVQSNSKSGLVRDDSPFRRTPEDKLSSSNIDADLTNTSATISGPMVDEFPMIQTPATIQQADPETPLTNHHRQESIEQESFIPDQSPQPGKELTLFLQYKSKIKKIVLSDGSNDLSMAGIQLAFIEKFQWNTHNHGVDLPEIYIQDQVSGVRHELEDLSDIKDRSVLVLNVEPLEEVKQHFDDGLGGIRQLLEGIKSTMDGQQLAMTQVYTRQDATAKDLARLAAQPVPDNNRGGNLNVHGTKTSFREINYLRRDLATIRTTLTSFSTGVTASMAAIRDKANAVKAKALEVEIPDLDSESGPAYVSVGKDTLGKGTEALINNVDDLQDIVEDLRKDVVTRGVRPLPRQLEQVSKDISLAHKELLRIKEYVKKEKPIWTKVWTNQLDTVMTDREFMTLQEDFISDLQTDLDMAAETFSLVEQATKQQNAETADGKPIVLRSTSRTHPLDSDMDPMKVKDSVLGEVRALRPNHETRLEAIERAEKARQKELQDRHENVAFKKELGNFVHESKLRKTVGIDELERQVRAKEESALRDEHQAVEGIKVARAKARAEERARQAAAQAAAMEFVDEGQVEHSESKQYEDPTDALPANHIQGSHHHLNDSKHGETAGS